VGWLRVGNSAGQLNLPLASPTRALRRPLPIAALTYVHRRFIWGHAVEIDVSRIRRTAEHFASTDPLEAYYSMFDLQRSARSAVDVDSGNVIQAAMRDSANVLDVGCGNGWRLLQCRHVYQHGTGIDVSEYAVGSAQRSAADLHVRNVDFVVGDAAHLPFGSGTLDFVYSERGPLGYNDDDLREALRVLRPGGRVFIETLSSLNLLEARQVFEGYVATDQTLLTSLDGERRRVESLGVQISLLAAIRRYIKFVDLCEWFAWQCSIWCYLHTPQPWPTDPEKLTEFARRNVAPDGSVALTYTPIWIGGTKRVGAACGGALQRQVRFQTGTSPTRSWSGSRMIRICGCSSSISVTSLTVSPP
jgi:SAM-dependent methyltransferase